VAELFSGDRSAGHSDGSRRGAALARSLDPGLEPGQQGVAARLML